MIITLEERQAKRSAHAARVAAFDRAKASFEAHAAQRLALLERRIEEACDAPPPTAPEKTLWMRALLVSLKQEGYVSPEHTGRVTLTLDLQQGGCRHCEIGEVVKLSA